MNRRGDFTLRAIFAMIIFGLSAVVYGHIMLTGSMILKKQDGVISTASKINILTTHLIHMKNQSVEDFTTTPTSLEFTTSSGMPYRLESSGSKLYFNKEFLTDIEHFSVKETDDAIHISAVFPDDVVPPINLKVYK